MNSYPSDLPNYLHRRLARRRKRLGLQVVQVARRSNLRNQRVSDFERHNALPSASAIEAMCGPLKTTRSYLTYGSDWLPERQRTPWAKQEALIMRRFKSYARYTPPVDRPALVRFLKAVRWYKDLAKNLIRQIRARKWGWPILCWLVHMPVDSELEALFDLRAFATEASPVTTSVQSAGFVQKPVVHPGTCEVVGHHPIPAFYLKLGELECLFFPQVTLQASKPYTVDYLVKVRWNKQSVWMILEIDGTLHRGGQDNERDKERDEDLAMTVVRLSEEEVKDPDCLRILERKLKERHPQNPM